MGMDESLLTGESVLTAAGSVDGGSGPSGSGDPIAIGKFSGYVVAQGDGDPTFGYLADPGIDVAAPTGSTQDPQLYPTSARTFNVLRVTATGGNGATAYTVTLYQNGVATAQQVTVPPSAVVGAEFVDNAHPIAFGDGDRYDLRWDKAASGDDAVAISAFLEGPAAGGVPGSGNPVVTDGTLIGNGTHGSPLGENPLAAQGPDWAGALRAIFQQRSGIEPLKIASKVWDFEDDNIPLEGTASQANAGFVLKPGGTGNVTRQNLAGGGVLMLGPDGSVSPDYADWTTSPSNFNKIGNIQAGAQFIAAFRIAVVKAPDVGSAWMAGIVCGGHYIGVGFTGAVADFYFSDGAGAPNNKVSTGVTIEPDGTSVTIYVACFDGNNIVACGDLETGQPEVIGEASSAAPNAAAYLYIYNEGTNADQVVLDAIFVACKRA